MNSNNSRRRHAPDISYFWLSLTDFLRESRPERLKDNRFIIARTDAATETYEQVIRSGGTPDEARYRTGSPPFRKTRKKKGHEDVIAEIIVDGKLHTIK